MPKCHSTFFEIFASRHPDPLLFIDAELSVTWFNEAAKRHLPQPMEDNDPRQIAVILEEIGLKPEDREEALSCIADGICQRIRCETGFWGEVVVDFAFGGDAGVEGILLTLLPRSTEQVARDHNRNVHAFLNQVGREMRARLQAILGNAELALSTREMLEDETDQREIDEVSKQSLKLSKLWSGTEEYLRLESEEEMVGQRPFSLASAVEEVMAEVEGEFAGSQFTFSFKIDENLPLGLIGRISEFQSLLRSMICGFLSKVDHHSVFCLIGWRLQSSLDRPALRIEIGVDDSIAEEEYGELMEVGPAGISESSIVDVWLLILNRLVSRAGGKLFHSMQDGSYARCRLDVGLDPCFEPFEAKPATLETTASVVNEGHAVSNIRALVVDDNRISLKVAARMLERLGCPTVDKAEDGLEALGLFRKNDYNIVFADLQMPGIDGFELARRVRNSTEDDRGLKIVAITADSSRKTKEKCTESGIDCCMTKPVTMGDLERACGLVADNEGIASGNFEDDVSRDDLVPILNIEDWSEDVDLHHRMLRMLVADAPAMLDEIKATWESGNMNLCEASVHRFKGSVDVVRADRVMNLCQDLLCFLRSEDRESASPLVSKIPIAYANFLDYLQRSDYLKIPVK